MKVYFHFMLGVSYDRGVITAVYQNEITDDKLDLKACVKQISKHLDEQKIDINVNTVEISTTKKKKITADTLLSTLTNGVDIFVKVKDDANKSRIMYEKTVVTKDRSKVKNDLSAETDTKPEVNTLVKKANKYLSKNRQDLAMKTYKEIMKISSTESNALLGLAYIYYKAERYEESLPYFEKLITLGSSDHEVLLDFGRALMISGDLTKSISVISRCINDLKRSNRPINMIHDANVALAEVLEQMGQLQNAFQMFLTVSQMTEKQHVNGLLGYARVGYKLNQVTLDDVFIIVLNAVAQQKKNINIKSYFTEMIQEKGGYEALQKQMFEAWSDAPAVIYIATFLREYGAVDISLKLLEHALSLAPKSIDIALLMVHLHENLCLFDKELTFVADFLDGKLDRHVVRKINLMPIVKCLRHLVKNETEELEELVMKELVPQEESKTILPSGRLVALELQLLALYFTMVKTCFTIGYLRPIPVFLKLLDPLFKMNDDLHKTLIRNEQAYYACISQIYHSVPPTIPNPSSQFIYFIGDSHILPLSWRNLNKHENNYVIKPVLVTGLKIWHLRKESKFYTKINFENAVKLVPNGSMCMIALGEIDFREGVVKAVEKGAYDDMKECMASLVDIYIDCLLNVQKRKKLKILVHPVPPVLNETAKNVKMFNEQLKIKVMKTPKLFWLEFVNELLDGEGCLKEEYHFDKAHLHPSYIKLLQNSLNEHF